MLLTTELITLQPWNLNFKNFHVKISKLNTELKYIFSCQWSHIWLVLNCHFSFPVIASKLIWWCWWSWWCWWCWWYWWCWWCWWLLEQFLSNILHKLIFLEKIHVWKWNFSVFSSMHYKWFCHFHISTFRTRVFKCLEKKQFQRFYSGTIATSKIILA